MASDAFATGFSTVFRYAVRKMLLSKRAFIAAGMALLLAFIMGYMASQDGMGIDDGVNGLDVLVIFFFLPVLAMVYGSSLIRDEMDDRSITQIVTSPTPRAASFLAYYLALSLSVSVMILIVLAAGFAAFFFQVGLSGGAAAAFAAMAAMVVIGSFAYSALFVALGVLFERPVYIGLLYAFFWEAFIGSMPGSVSHFTVKHLVRSLGSVWLDHGDISRYAGADASWAAAAIVVFIAIMLAIGILAFEDKEFP